MMIDTEKVKEAILNMQRYSCKSYDCNSSLAVRNASGKFLQIDEVLQVIEELSDEG